MNDRLRGPEAPKELRTVKMCLARTAEVLEDTPFWVAQNLGYLAEPFDLCQ